MKQHWPAYAQPPLDTCRRLCGVSADFQDMVAEHCPRCQGMGSACVLDLVENTLEDRETSD